MFIVLILHGFLFTFNMYRKKIFCVYYNPVRWSDFEKNATLSMYVVPHCCRTPIPKFHVLMLPLHLSQCLREF